MLGCDCPRVWDVHARSRKAITMTMTEDREPLGADFSEGDGRLIDAFVTGFRSVKTRSNYRANLSAWLRWTT